MFFTLAGCLDQHSWLHARGATLVVFQSQMRCLAQATPYASALQPGWKDRLFLVMMLRGNHPPVPTCRSQ
jgi:hypothetical protein